MSERDIKERLGWAFLVIELSLLLASVALGLSQGWEQVNQPLQILVIFIIGTIFTLLYEAVWKDYDERKKEHPGTHHEIRT